MCKNQKAIGVIRYQVEMSVHNNGNKATFVLFDNDVAQLTGRQAADILDNYLEVDGGEGAGHEIPFPQCIFDAIGQTHKFEVTVKDYNFTAARQTIIVSRIVESAEHPELKTKSNKPLLCGESSNTKPTPKETTTKRARYNPP